ncbi:hypothetical protein COU18_01085 [Candidatus Kaiserbacteria bacterium CG10_big_fil_rev_8_21_14_0_10_51_14]|uniref:Peptidoglycan binding-like domain-containing protein n=1 Tax=Candidatus Kaiserbacteria bacterium CG10_big_fil_rev_8_21_14_0_10_51_14 TaxID=1974610 RepID=A0A2H0UDX2_9BACT|nr:MAG: hypothetical protein COU18_01085 [Candidatus Kaiserbacteria bacterium CG10_big_fil_rev_8_21_14_0_10_51_14]
MTSDLRRASAWIAFFFALLAAGTLLVGNQRLAYADVPPNLGSQIVCDVQTDLNALGSPIPRFPRNCPGTPPPPPQCSDGIDNDGDGLIDFPADPGCTSGDDDTEAPNPSIPPSPPPSPACSNGIDDDGDGFIDANDPNCHTDGNPTNSSSYDPNRSEAGPLPACTNGLDDDGDGKIDFPADPGCTSAIDTNETDPTTAPQCSDGIDNDSDALIDTADPGCHTDFNASNSSSYDASRNDEAASASIGPAPSACSDGLDNDGDGLIDMNDPGCNDSSDTDETNTAPSSGGGGGGGGGVSNLIVQGPAGFVPSGAVLGASTPPPVADGESCDQYLTAFIKSGAKNDENQVRRLQYVLRDFEGFSNIQVNGIYDAATLVAVHAFQTKYASEILAPWGISESTGFTYLTTRKKVNEIYCRDTKQFPLTASEQQTIERVRTGQSVPVSNTVQTPSAAKHTTTSSGGGEARNSTSEAPKNLWDRVLEILR